MLTYRGRDELDTRFGELAARSSSSRRSPRISTITASGSPSGSRCRRSCCSARRSIAASSADDRAARVRAALARVTAETIVVGVPGDMLFPLALQVELYRELQAVGAQSSLWKLDSEYGHDAFLADQDRLAACLRGAGAFGGELRDGARGRASRASASQPVREMRIGMVGCGTVGQRRARDDRAAAQRDGRALWRALPRVEDRRARSHQGSRARSPPASR